jgi:hypothetical protein
MHPRFAPSALILVKSFHHFSMYFVSQSPPLGFVLALYAGGDCQPKHPN